MRLPAGGTAKFSSPHRASSSTHSGGPPSQRGVPQLASRRAGARQLSPCRHRAGRTAAGVRRTTPQVAAAAAAEQQDARALAHAVAGMALEAEVATAAQEPPYQTECVRVDPASFAWPSAATAAAPPPDGDGNGDALQQLAHIQHDLDFRSTPPHAAANGAHTAGAAADNDDVAKLQRAAALIRQGHTVAMPTETVYGLAASALDAAAVRRIYAAKRRPADNPLIVHVSSLDMLHALYPPGWQLPPQYAEVVARHWPGPLTILLPRSDKVPGEVVCGQATMAVRLPAHPVARALIALAGVPLAAPSANSSGRPSPTLAQHVVQDLGGRVPLVIDGGPCHSGVESTVLDGLRSPPAVLRPGGVTVEQLSRCAAMQGLQVYRKDFVDRALEQAPTTPGMKYRHYSPDAPILLVDLEGAQDPPLGPSGSLRAAADARVRGLVRREAARLLAQGPAQQAGSGGEVGDGLEEEPGEEGQQGHRRRPGRRRGDWRAEGRPGPLVGVLRTTCAAGQAPGLVPGDRASEYGLGSEAQDAADGHPQGGGLAGGVPFLAARVCEYVLGAYDAPGVVARELFVALRRMDELGVDLIVAEGVVEADEGLAVMNRLRKAASHVVPLGELPPH